MRVHDVGNQVDSPSAEDVEVLKINSVLEGLLELFEYHSRNALLQVRFLVVKQTNHPVIILAGLLLENSSRNRLDQILKQGSVSINYMTQFAH